MKWDKPKCIGDIPTARSGHTFTNVESVAYMFGGCATSSDRKSVPGPSNDLYKLDMSTESEYYWAKLELGNESPRPCARWKHSATKIDDTQIVVFGGFTSSKETPRLNDVWVLDTSKDVWISSEDSVSSGSCQLSLWEAKGNAKHVDCPCPRGSHSSALVDDNIFIFGGYGGNGYARKDFNDLHVLCTKTWKWFELVTTGDSPQPRSGHKSVYFDGRFYVMGGWNAVETFNDVHILDVDSMMWTRVDSASGLESWGEHRWNFTAVATYSVPYWKIFVFGGNSGILDPTRPQGYYQNDMHVLETIVDQGGKLRLEWSRPIVLGNRPCPRSDTEMFYSPATGVLTLFGGWSNCWHEEVYSCHVGSVVGPTYNIFSITSEDCDAPIGPVTGGSRMILSGKGFCSVSSVASVIRLVCDKGFIDVSGEVLDDENVSFCTPNFLKYGAVRVDVRLKIGSQSFTNNSVDFSYFSVTSSEETVAFGPGILRGNNVNQQTLFAIQAKDKHCNNRISGMDEFIVKIDHLGTDGKETGVDYELVDKNNGTYCVHYTPHFEGNYRVDIQFVGTFKGHAGSIRGSCFQASAVKNEDGKPAFMAGELVQQHISVSIGNLKTFVSDGVKSLTKKEIAKDDLKTLVSVKETLRGIENQANLFETSIAATRANLQYLKKEKMKLPHLETSLKQLEMTCKSWFNLKVMVPVARERISFVDSAWTDKIKFKIEAYSKELQEKLVLFRKNHFWTYFGSQDQRLSKSVIDNSLAEAKVELESESRLLEENSYLCDIFDLQEFILPCQGLVEEMKQDIVMMKVMWKISEDLDEHITTIEKQVWRNLNVESLEDKAKEQLKAVKSSHKCVRWSPTFRAVDIKCKDYLSTIPLISLLMSKAMRPRHWGALIKVTKRPDFRPPTINNDIILGDVLSLNLHKISNDVEEICDQAVKEEKIEQTLAQMEERWSKINFTMSPYKKQNSHEEIPLLGIIEEDFESLENDQLVIQSILVSRFVAQFRDAVTKWQKELFNVNEVFLLISEIQRTWSYLEPLFIHSEEVKRELPEDTTRFASIDDNVQTMLKNAWATQNVNKAFNGIGLAKNLEFLQEQLDLCKKSLADFLDGRRRQFPRYYFVSEADLLDILSNGSHPEKILVHIPKVYLCTKTLIFSPDSKSEEGRPIATEFVAGVGSETCSFEPPLPLNGKVEIYMQHILDAQKESLFQTVKRSLVRYQEQTRKEWVLAKSSISKNSLDPAQTTLLVLAINYVAEVEQKLIDISRGERNALIKYSEKQKHQLSDLIQLTQSDLTEGDRTRVMVCITMDSHSRDIVEKMNRNKVVSLDSFLWQSQLKHKYRAPLPHARYQNRDPNLRGPDEERAEIVICDAILPYDYEYLGNGPRLVITPLTDRVYVTATQALNLNMGCAPAGPAGTGKTETTKDLANALAKVIYVINCEC